MNDIVSTLKALNLHGMASAWPEVLGTARLKTLDHEAVLHQLLKAEAAQREVRSMAYQMRVARFPSHRDLAGFDFAQASVDEGLVRELHQLKFLDCAHNVGAPVPMTAEVQEILQWLHSNGKGQADHSAIAQYYEHLTGIKLGRDL